MAPYTSLNATDRWNKVIAPQRAVTVEPSGSATGG
jgi:hypothetical protein